MHMLKRIKLTLSLPAVLVLAGMGNFACTTLPAGDATAQVSAPAGVAQSPSSPLWEEAVRAFSDGDYARAASLFEVMAEEARNPLATRKGLYGLAAARLMLAQTPKEFGEALAVWKAWSDQITQGFENEDPRMLTPVLERLLPPGTPPAKLPDQIAKLPRLKKAGPQKPSAPGNHAASSDYKSQLHEKERELERMRTRLESREREVRRLKHQIESLEEIHLKFQERKQETSQ